MADTPKTGSRVVHPGHGLRVGVIALLVGSLIFFTTSAIFIVFGGTPPAATPVASIVGHAGWFGGVACLAIGVTALVLRVDALRTGLAGYLAVGTLGLGVLTGLQWMTWAWVDVLAAQHDQYQGLLDGLISPFGSGLSLMYGLLVGAGVGLLSWGIRPAKLTHQAVSWSGVVIGGIALFGTGAVFLSASKNIVFAANVLVIPVVYIWALIFAIDVYRQQ